MIVCWSAKGGSGTTVTASALALLSGRHTDTVLVDLGGDAPMALGVPRPGGPGIAEWMRSSAADAEALDGLCVPVGDAVRLLPAGDALTLPASTDGAPPDQRWERLSAALGRLPASVVVDAGTGWPPNALVDGAQRSLLVVRACYLALARMASTPFRPTGVVFVREPGRALGADDVAVAVGAPIAARVELDPAVARAVDAGLLCCRLPDSLRRALRHIVSDAGVGAQR